MLREAAHSLIWVRRHLNGELRVPELPCLLPFLQTDDVFLDVGAHAGGWAVPISRRLRRGHVYAFEALPYYARVLGNVLWLLRRRNVTVIVGAVADRPGVVSVVWKDAEGRRLTGKTHISGRADPAGSVTVPSLTIDGFCAGVPPRRVRLMKCDVEGAELLVFRGATETIGRWRPVVFCELYAEYCARYGYGVNDVFDFFEPRSYRTFTVQSGRLLPLDPASYAGRGDVVFIPSEIEPAGPCV